MSDWKAIIRAGGSTLDAVTQYADERIASLTKICVSTESSESQIRSAQAGIHELERLKGLQRKLIMEFEARK